MANSKPGTKSKRSGKGSLKSPRRRFRRNIKILIGLLAIYLFACLIIAMKFISPTRIHEHPPKWLVQGNVSTKDGLCNAWHTPNILTAKRVFVLAYGLKASLANWQDQMKDLEKLGIGAIAIDMPGQGYSPSPHVGFGPREADVVVRAATYVHKLNPEAKITAYGFSMGGAAVWLASAERPDLFHAIVCEASYSNLGTATTDYLDRNIKGLHYLLFPMIWMASYMDQVDISKVRPVDAAAKWKGKPCLIIYDTDDVIFSRSEAEKLAAACGGPIWTVPNTPHACAYLTHPKELISRLDQISR